MVTTCKFPWRPMGLIGIIVTAAVLLPVAKGETGKTHIAQHGEARQIGEATKLSAKAMPSTIRGVVTDELGRPRGNVSIGDAFPKGLWRGVRTDECGRFSLKDIKPEQKQWIAYSQASRAMGFFTIPKDYNGQAIHVILNLREAETEGRVVDTKGRGLANREIKLIVQTEDGFHYHSSPLKTDENGYYQTTLTPSGPGLAIQARLVGPSEGEQECITKAIKLSNNQIFIDISTLVVGGEKIRPDFDKNLANGRRVLYGGRVVNEQGEPISDVEVELSYKKKDHMVWSGASVMTDKSGRWKRKLPAELPNLSIRLSHPDYISFHFDQSEQTPSPAELRDGSSVMVMKRGLRIKGKVLNEKGEPIENTLIAAGRLYSRTSYGEVIEDCTTARTLTDGSFSIDGLPAGNRDIVVSAVGYAPRVASIEIEEEMKPIQVILKGGRTYTGQVVDADGEPLEGVKITCREWKLKERHSLTRIAQTDSDGRFKIEQLPDEGTLSFIFNKRKSGYQGFLKEMPSDLSKPERIVMYKKPVITGKVIDSETEEAITSFELVSGAGEKSDEELYWSRYYKKKINSQDGTFSENVDGFIAIYPFDEAYYFKIVAKGYLPGITPPVKLGEKYEPFVVRLIKAEPWKGTVIGPDGNPAMKAEVAWVGPGRKAFVKGGKFDRRGFTQQAEFIIETNKQGQFELTPSKDEGLIVALHKSGYAQVKSSDYKNGSEIKLTAWAKIEGTINLPEAIGKSSIVRIQPARYETDSDTPSIDWMFDEISHAGDSFNFDYVPSIPLLVGRVIRWELSNAVYLTPKPGQTCRIHIDSDGRTVTGRIVYPMAEKGKTSVIEFTNPRRVHTIAYRIEPKVDVPAEIKSVSQSGFLWLWRGVGKVYENSTTLHKKFIPEIDGEGNFKFQDLHPGEYEFVVNIHDPLPPDTCGRGVLKAVGITRFTVAEDNDKSPLQISPITMRPVVYPEIGDPAPLFEIKTLDGKDLKLAEFRGKVVLLDFWATWCAPCVAETPKLKELYDAFGEDEQFVMIGLSLDWDIKAASRFVKHNELKWLQGFLGDMSKSTVAKEYGIMGIPAKFLIGPDGKIIAKNLKAEELKLAVVRSLGKHQGVSNIEQGTLK